MQPSNIAWTDQTWNPVHGCSKVSAGCDNCYAERISRQYEHTEHPWTNEYAQENELTPHRSVLGVAQTQGSRPPWQKPPNNK